MATRIRNIIALTVPANGTVAVAHGLNYDESLGLVPDEVTFDNPALEFVSAGATNITVQNLNGVAESGNAMVVFWYSPERAFGAAATTDLVPKPYVPVGSDPDGAGYIFPGEPQEVRYVRTTGGNDANDGLTPATAWLTQSKGLAFVAGFSTNRSKILDVSDCVFAANEQLNLPALLGGVNFDLDFAGLGPNNFSDRSIGQIRASQTLQQALTVTLVTPDATTGLVVLTVAEVLVVNAHVGQLVIGSGLVEYGVVQSNGVNTLTLSTLNAVWTAPVGAYTPSCSWTFGDAANFFQQATYAGILSNYTFQGINFLANGAAQSALTLYTLFPVHLQLCQIEGLVLEGGGHATMDACYITRRFAQNGAAATIRSSFFDAVTFNNHGDGASGVGQIQGCMFDGCGPLLSGNLESRMGLSMSGCEIDNATAQGIIFRGANLGFIEDTRIQNSAADGIRVDTPCLLRLDTVVGAANVGYGVELLNGAQLEAVAGVTLTGTLNDVFLGGTGAVAWAAAPATDVGAVAPQFCRLF